MEQKLTRRSFLATTLVGSAAAGAAANDGGVCVALCNHWSYIGIGWQLGIESNVLSVVDAMEMADRPPHVKTCINLDARAYELMAEKFPEIADRLKKYLAAGKVELIGGSYGQPLGTMFSGESNIRQIVYGREVIRKALGYEMVTFLEEEEYTHPQIPQILVAAGYRYASLAQVDTWGAAGIPRLELNVFDWKGQDGTTIPSTPKNSLYFAFSVDPKALAESPGFRKLSALGKPLVFTWEEFGWESPEKPSYRTTPEKYQKLADRFPVEFVTLQEYMSKYGGGRRESVYFNMDSWDKLLTWGLGGDQLRILDRKVEAALLAAERFDAIVSSLDGQTSEPLLEKAWRDLLTSQSHDVSLCEYSRWQGDRMAPLDRSEDYHNFTWGTIGYNHLDAARKQAASVLEMSLSRIGKRIRTASAGSAQLTATVYNPCDWARTGVASTGRIYPLPVDANDIIVKDVAGRVMPSQLVSSERNAVGNLVVATVEFVAEKVPSIGYDTYYLEFTTKHRAPASTGLRINESGLAMENEYVKVRLDPATGAVASLVDKKTGREMLQPSGGQFPRFHGKPNPTYTPRSIFGDKGKTIPAEFDSASSTAQIDWMEKGPLRATVRAQHNWPLLKFETRVTLTARLPYVEVISRVLSSIPPMPDALNEKRRFPAEIKGGYWLSFAPAFEPSTVIRDFPLGIEPTAKSWFHALTFVDLVGQDVGLLVLHPGTQYFKRDAGGTFSNLVMREWESYFTGEYGWPRYSEYTHVLVPHGLDYSHVARKRASSEFSHRLLTVTGRPHEGDFPPQKSFLNVTPENIGLLALRRKSSGGLELRVAEIAGSQASAQLELALPIGHAEETDLLGHTVANIPLTGSRLKFPIRPWKLMTFVVR